MTLPLVSGSGPNGGPRHAQRGESLAAEMTRRVSRVSHLGDRMPAVPGYRSNPMAHALEPDPVTEEVRSRWESYLRQQDRLAHDSLAAGNFAGAAAYFRNVAQSCEQAAEEQNRGWIMAAGMAR